MSEANAIEELRRDVERKHRQNLDDREKDREAFRASLASQQATFDAAMNTQRNLFQEALNKMYAEFQALDKTAQRNHVLLQLAVGSGLPGEGRLGILEETVEMLKKFRWQALAILSFLLLAADKLAPALQHVRQ